LTLDPQQAWHRLSGEGLVLDLGALSIRVRSDLPALASAMAQVYEHYEDSAEFVDTQVVLERCRSWPKLWQPRIRFLADGTAPFDSVEERIGLAQFEWGVNWVYAHLCSRHLLLHAGSLEHAGVGMMLAASPGSGKSTLTAALALRGFRVLSDEFGTVRLADRMMLPLAKPVSLKNASIELIRAWSPQAIIGPVFRGTHKGDVAHLGLPAHTVARRREPARPGLIFFPTWQAGEPVTLTPVMPARAPQELAHNSFNFARLGQPGFAAACDLVSACACYRLTYGSLAEVVPMLRDLCEERAREWERRG